MDPESEGLPKKLSHKQYKAFLRKEKRQHQRQAAAKLQDEQEAKNAPPPEEPPLEEAARLAQIELEQERKEEEERKLAHEAWLERERQAQEVFEQQRKREEAQKQKLLEEQRRIQEEWEARQEKENRSQSKKEQELEDILQQLDKEIATGEDRPTHNPEAPRQAQQAKREPCPFFLKTGGCRFGDRCSRAHPQPEMATTLLFPHMYTDFTLEQSHRDEYDTDIGLEYDEGDAYERFLEFYQDVLPELREFGAVVQFKVCCNWEPHLRGNVYVQYKTEEGSSKARESFHCRFYAGKQLSCIYTPVSSWKAAICGMFHQNKCSRGKNCNFLHVFQNPNREFVDADRDFQMMNSRGGQSQRGWRHDRDRSYRDRSRERIRDRRRRSRSGSRDRRRRSKERSRSRERRSRYSSRRHRSRSHDRTRKKRSRTRSRSRSRSPHRSSRRQRSRSNSRSRRRSSRSPRRTRRRSQDRLWHHRSRSRSRHRESRSLSNPRRSSSRSVSPPRSSRLRSPNRLRNRRSHSRSRDRQLSSSDSDDGIPTRKCRMKKRRKSAKDYSTAEPCNSSDKESIDNETNEVVASKCENHNSKRIEDQDKNTTNGHQNIRNAVVNLSTDQPKIKSEKVEDSLGNNDRSTSPESKTKGTEDRHQSSLQDESIRTGHSCLDGQSTGDDSQGESEDDSKSFDNRHSRSSSKEKHSRSHHSHKRKHKRKHKKRHKKHSKASALDS